MESAVIGHPYDIIEEDVDTSDEKRKLEIRIWCLLPQDEITKKSGTFVVIVKNFRPKCYIEIPDYFHPFGSPTIKKPWTSEDVNKLIDEVRKMAKIPVNEMVSGKLVKKSKLYYYQPEEKSFNMIELSFETNSSVSRVESFIENAARIKSSSTTTSSTTTSSNGFNKGGGIRGKFYGQYFGNMVLRVWEGQKNIVSSTRRLFTLANIEYAQWTLFKPTECININDDNNTFKVPCYIINLPLTVDYDVIKRRVPQYIMPCPIELKPKLLSAPSILAFDIEVYSHRPAAFPDPLNDDDKLYMISCVYYVHRGGSENNAKRRRRFLIHSEDALLSHDLNHPSYKNEGMTDVEFLVTEDEASMMDAFASLVEELNPDIITGYNIHGFDYRFMDVRNRITGHSVMGEWPTELSRSKSQIPKAKKSSWKSAAYGTIENTIVEMEGRMSIDMMLVVKRNYKLSVYNLKFVSAEFLPESTGKLDVTPQEMFKTYKLSMEMYEERKKNPKIVDSFKYKRMVNCITNVAAYAIRDSELVIDLFEKLNTWPGLVELSNVAGVTIKDTFGGQQPRVMSLLYDICSRDDIVIDTRTFKREYVPEGEEAPPNLAKIKFKGGFVMEPQVGITDNVICGDFVSLYPSIILAYNICYSTLNITSSLFEETLYSGNAGRFDEEIAKKGNKIVLAVDTNRTTNPKYLVAEGKKINTIEFVNSLSIDDNDGGGDDLDDGVAVGGKNDGEAGGEDVGGEDDGGEAGGEDKKTKKKCKKQLDLEKLPEYNRRFEFNFVSKDVKLGVVPRLVEKLLTSRKEVKNQMSAAGKAAKRALEEGDEVKANELFLLEIVLNQRQLAYKMIANSTYGFMAAQDVGKLPLVECAMSITAMGRILIGKVNDFVRTKYKGNIVYGDTDSSMFTLPHNILESKDCHAWGKKVTEEITEIFPKPLVLEFEKAMRILCLKKKKYAAFYIQKDGSLSKQMLVRGIVLARRDNCRYLRTTYETIIREILLGHSAVDCFKLIYTAIINLFEEKVNIEELSVVVGLGANYKSPGYKMAVFAQECAKIGCPVQPGDRLEFLIAKRPSSVPEEGSSIKPENLGYKMRMFDAWKQNRLKNINSDPLDYLYYLDHQFKNPIDQIFSVAFPETDNTIILNKKKLSYGKNSSDSSYTPSPLTVTSRTPIKLLCTLVTSMNNLIIKKNKDQHLSHGEIADYARMLITEFEHNYCCKN